MTHHSALSHEAREILNLDAPSGMMAREPIVMDLAVHAIKHRADCSHGFVLDGLPKTEEQARILQSARIVPDAVLILDTPHTDVLRRLSGRWIHKPSRRIYHDVYCPPKKPGIDDVTKEPLEQRPEDQKESVMQRIAEYEEEVKAICSFYTQPSEQAGSGGASKRGASSSSAGAIAPPCQTPPLRTLQMGDAPLHHLYEVLSAVLDPIYMKEQPHSNDTSRNQSFWSRLWPGALQSKKSTAEQKT